MHCRAASVCRWGSLSLGQSVAGAVCRVSDGERERESRERAKVGVDARVPAQAVDPLPSCACPSLGQSVAGAACRVRAVCARARVCVCVCVCVRVSVCVCFGVDALVRVSAVVLTGRRRRQLKQQEHPLHRSERQFCRGCRGSGPGLMIGRKMRFSYRRILVGARRLRGPHRHHQLNAGNGSTRVLHLQ